MRIVSLVPSATETLLSWGVAPIACTRFCEQPGIAHVGGTKDPDVGAIIALAPDLVVVDEEENRREDAEALRAAGLAVHASAIRAVDHVAPALRALAAAVAVGGVPVPDDGPIGAVPTTRRAFVPIWRRPWMALGAGTYGSSLLAACGVANVFDDAVDRYPETTLEEVAARRPDIVLAPSEPYPFRERHVAELSEVAPVVLVDGQDLFWWGARTPAALERLRSALA